MPITNNKELAEHKRNLAEVLEGIGAIERIQATKLDHGLPLTGLDKQELLQMYSASEGILTAMYEYEKD